MNRYLVEGRVVPERVDFNVPRMDGGVQLVDEQRVDFQLYVWKSKIFVHVQAPENVRVPELRNVLFTLLANLINYAGFYQVLGISYELDSITNIDTKETTVFGVEGCVFEEGADLESSMTFFTDAYGEQLPITPSLLINKFFCHSTFELRNAIRYPDFTALHCRLAIESVRNYFDENKDKAWPMLRAADGYKCLRCGKGDYWKKARGLFTCRACGYEASVLAGTLFQDTHKPLRLCFRRCGMW